MTLSYARRLDGALAPSWRTLDDLAQAGPGFWRRCSVRSLGVSGLALRHRIGPTGQQAERRRLILRWTRVGLMCEQHPVAAPLLPDLHLADADGHGLARAV